MKLMIKKNWKLVSLIGGISAVLIVAMVLVFSNTKGKAIKINPEFGQYITAYTSGIVSKTTTVQIKLNYDVAQKIKNSKLSADLFDFSPSVKGDVAWKDNQTIEFSPEKYLKNNTLYSVKFYLPDLVEDAKNIGNFEFQIQTIKQNFDFEIEKTITIDKKTFEWQKTSGTLFTADVEEMENIENVFKAFQNNNQLKISWEADETQRKFSFEIDSVRRYTKPSAVKLVWNGDAIDVDNEGEKLLEIKSLDDFAFISTRIEQQPEQCIFLQFSDPLDETQDLTGIVNIQYVSNLKFFIEDNIIKVFPPYRLTGKYNLNIAAGIKNIVDKKITETFTQELIFEELKPQVRMVNTGVILPPSDDGLLFPFEAVNLKAVDVKIYKIFENNITQFLQVNSLDGGDQLTRVGRPILRKVVKLDNTGDIDFSKWNRFYLDLTELIDQEPGAIYRVSIGFRQIHSLYYCGEEGNSLQAVEDEWEKEEEVYEEDDYYYYYDDYYYDYDYDEYWDNYENPCHSAYYGQRHTVAQNIFVSNFGIIAKETNAGDVKIFVTNLKTTETISGATIELYDYQQQLIETKLTERDGSAMFVQPKNPYFVVVKMDSERGYLKLRDGNSLSLSRFDVSGQAIEKGLKGFIYGERGVWRPGDSIFISFILQENINNEPLPEKHPVVFELFDPMGKLVERIMRHKNEANFYSFHFKTDTEALTGNYSAKIAVGGATFSKILKIETVKPNRLKINFDFKKEEILIGDENTVILNTKWLHGAVGKNLNTKVEAFLSEIETEFKKYPDYTFTDFSKNFYSESEIIFDDKTDNNGNANVNISFSTESESPGKLKATFVTKVFEPGGEFSTDRFSIPYSPYTSYLGIKTPTPNETTNMLLTDTLHTIDLVLVTPEGELLKKNRNIEIKLLKIDWRWWWETSEESLSYYVNSSSIAPIKSDNIQTKNGVATWKFQVNRPEWGRFLVHAYDTESGHSCSKIIYLDWPGWAGRPQQDQDQAMLLSFSSNKDKYEVGENISLNIPTSPGGRALISIENGSRIINSYWLEAKEEFSKFSFEATQEMTPNIFVNVTFIQPHAQTANDLPIRLYGVIPILVENKETHIQPIINMPNELKSEESFKLKISEENGKAMTYTIAIVDEGLLDLTRFKTPNPWETFYAREALGVKTWDIYNEVIGAYKGDLQRLLSIGGDADLFLNQGKKANRFEPVVKFLGPFQLAKGKKATHTIVMPKYVGSVRTMVVARSEDAYGSAEKTNTVTKPLMILGTLPRVLGPSEKVKLPVSVFVMDKTIKNVTVSIETNEFLKISGAKEKKIVFKEIGDDMVEFDLEVLPKLGIGTVNITAVAGKEKADYKIEIDVRNPNPEITDFISEVVSAGASFNTGFVPLGMSGTNVATLEVSAIPPIDLERRMRYLLNYPHGCIEQTISAVFPQLYIDVLSDVDAATKLKIQQNIEAAIQKLSSFQTSEGGFSYWAGGTEASIWGTNYAGHFMLEAKLKGYKIPTSVYNNWLKFQKKRASDWKYSDSYSEMYQAYRLYTLALSGNALAAPMNRMREMNLSPQTKWRLAATYILDGKKQVATEIINNLTTEVIDYKELSYTYGSGTRDKAMILETLILLENKTLAYKVLEEIAADLSSTKWMSTQTTGYSLLAVSKYIEAIGGSGEIKFEYQWAKGKVVDIKTAKSIAKIDFKNIGTDSITVKFNNKSNSVLYMRIVYSGTPIVGETSDAENGLRLNITYTLPDGTVLDPLNIEQGTDFVAQVQISHNGISDDYKELALTQIFPSGWEIINTRLLETESFIAASKPTYQDIRDDRVYTYFDLDRNKTKMFRVLLNATYTGTYYMPTVKVEAMYDATINARKAGKWINVVKQK